MQRLKKILTYLLFSSACLLGTIVLKGCKEDNDAPPGSQNETGSWTIYTPYQWTHDGQPYQSTYCTVYSDAANADMKQQLGEIADEHFLEIMQQFNFQRPSEFIHPPGYSKIEIYLNRNHTENINWAYWGGFIFTIRSTDISEEWIDYTIYTVRHELTHVFEFLIEGQEVLGTDVWFREGLAVYLACMRSNIFETIKTQAELEAWISENQDIAGKGNPILIHQHSDFPEGTGIHSYYRIFELAVRYLVDSNGMGRSFGDILNLLYDIRDNSLFPTAFSGNFGINLEDFETDFYVLMKSFFLSV